MTIDYHKFFPSFFFVIFQVFRVFFALFTRFIQATDILVSFLFYFRGQNWACKPIQMNIHRFSVIQEMNGWIVKGLTKASSAWKAIHANAKFWREKGEKYLVNGFHFHSHYSKILIFVSKFNCFKTKNLDEFINYWKKIRIFRFW